MVATDVWRRIPGPIAWVAKKWMITVEDGAAANLRCATDPALGNDSGRFYDVGGVEKAPSRVSEDAALQAELWRKSAEWVGLPAA